MDVPSQHEGKPVNSVTLYNQKYLGLLYLVIWVNVHFPHKKSIGEWFGVNCNLHLLYLNCAF